MTTQARAVVIGGGIAGACLLYHLTRLGWRDVVLVEKGELTVGSTWHAARNIPHFSTSYVLSRLHLESSRFYQAFESEHGRAVGFHKTGSIRLATTEALALEHKRHAGKARYLGLPLELIGPSEVKTLFPLVSTEGVLGAAHTPEDGHVDPASLPNALAAAP